MQNFQKLEVWKLEMEIAKLIYTLTETFPRHEIYGLISQIRRSAISIPSNISEGAGRDSKKEFNQFLVFALGSSYELTTQIILAGELRYLSNENAVELLNKLDKLQRMLNKLKQSIHK